MTDLILWSQLAITACMFVAVCACAGFVGLQTWVNHMLATAPHVKIKDEGREFLYRWIIVESKFFRFYVHHQFGDDGAREFHDHPWWNLSIILRGGYLENFPSEYDELPPSVEYYLWPNNVKNRKPGHFILRRPETAHRITLPTNVMSSVSLFFTGPKVREWGFWCPKKGWVHWQRYCTSSYNGSPVMGKRCED